MRTRKLLQIVPLCVLLLLFAVPLALSQQQKTWSKLVKHADKTVKGKYKPDLVIPDGGTSEPAMSVQEARLRGESIRRSKLSAYIEAAKLAELAAKGSQNKSRLSSNLPRSHYKSIEIREKIRRYKNVTIGDGICQSIDIRNNVVFFAILQQCRVIEGFLQIVLIENNDEIEFQNISFPKLREITGYFLLYRVNGLKSLSNLFPNLEVIRGDILLTDYAFMVYEMKNLQEIGLRKLTQISRGGVRIEKNPSLCYTNTLNWDIIVTAGDNFIKDNGNDGSCPGCSQCPSGHCWTAQHCQRMEKPNCHEQCLGECFGPTEKDCYVCKHFQHQGKCVERCPPHLYAYLSRRCITKAECQNMSRVRRVFKNEIEQTWRPYNGSCLTQCPEGYEDDLDADNKTTCRVCQDRCRKIGNGAIIRHISDAQSYRGTTVVRGALEFQIRNGNPNIMNELTDAFGLIEEITEYIKVTHSFPITSLGFFKKLKVIKGERLDINNASVVVLDNPNLSSLFPESQKIKIENGRLFFHYNPKLCLSKIIQFGNMVNITNLTELEVQPESNGEKVACDIVNINITIREMGADYVDLMWDSYKPSRGQHLLSYLLSYIETENENITYEANACGNNTWQIVDVDVDVDFRSYSNFTQVVTKHISNLKPYTKYAVYVKTFTARNRKQERSSTSSPVGQSEIIFFRTKSTIPSMPINLASTMVSDTETLVKWDPPAYPNGPIGYYMISGSIRSYDKALLSSRNYCTNILVDEPEEQAVPEVTIKTPIITPLSYCSKDVTPMKMVTSKKFEIFCHENVTISYLSPGWKDYCVFNRYNSLDDFHELLDDMSSTDVGEKFEKSVNTSDPFDYTKKTLVEGQTFLYNVSAGNNSYLLRNLRHFSLYTISISACGVKTLDEAQMCSTVQYISARTGRREDADNVNNVKVSVTNNTIVEVSWDPVKEPNGLTVSYTIEYTNLDVKDAKKSTECIPCTLHKDTYASYYIKNLSPGRYSLRVRSTSLAGDGNFSKAVWFSIGLTDENPIALVSLLTLGCLSVILVMSCLFYRSYLKKKQQEKLIASVNPDYIETKYIVDSWEVARECVEILEELGLGNFGMVYRGRLDNGVEVAIKTISETASQREKNEFLNEASVMKNFSTFHLIKLLGVVSIGNPPFVIMELMENGDLKAYLRRIRDTNLVPNASRIIRMAAEIADGMAYLESKKFVHRDLAARNCMVSKDLVCKVGDFGMVRDIYETEYYKIGKKGLLPIRWMAPENLCDGVFTSDSDVWSFGVVLYEILTLAEIPYQGFTNEEVMSYVLHKGVLNIPRNCPENIYKIMEKCFKWRPSDRPTFMEIVAELEPFLGQDFCEKSFYHSEDGVEIRNAGIKKVYHHAAPIRFHWGNETARWVREFEDNVTLLDQTKAGTSRSRIFKNGFQHFGNVTNLEDVPLDR